MDEYLIWLIFLALAIFGLSMVLHKDRNCKALLADNRRLYSELDKMQTRLREREMDIDQIQRSSANLLKWKSRAIELEEELKDTKRTREYASASRLEYLEGLLEPSPDQHKSALFLETFQPRGRYSFEDRLRRMLESAKFEVVIVSPWIKRQMWERIRVPLNKFTRRGGRLRVFIRGCESDFSSGLSDDIVQDVRDLGGDIFAIKQLHAKLYMVDRKEAIVASANLTKGGIEGNYETGIWLNDPAVMRDICQFLEDLYRCK
jgi:hypothetical protein